MPSQLVWFLLMAPVLAITAFLLGRARSRAVHRRGMEEQLRHTQRLETSNQVTRGIAHDLNNIIAIAIGYGEMARDDVPDPSLIRANIDEALKAQYRARDLLEQFLTFSRGGTPDRKPLRIAPVVEDSLLLVKASLPKNVTVEKAIDLDAGLISADRSQLYQIIVNLCLNAGDAMREGGGVLTVGLAPTDVEPPVAGRLGVAEGGYVRLSVRDSGTGMPPHVLARIFEPFYTTKSPGEGTGIGLSVVEAIARTYGGCVTVSSRPGEGTTFEVLLPRSSDDAGLKEAEEAGHAPGGSPRVLFVDDEEPLARMAQQMLERLGYEVITETDSQNALQLFKDEPERFDLVITDYFMPKLSGTELARKLKCVRPDIPLILITGYGHIISRQQAEKVGFREYLLKPMATRDLGRAVNDALRGSEAN